jgi:TM2 domain-containing membrane protein YozV
MMRCVSTPERPANGDDQQGEGAPPPPPPPPSWGAPSDQPSYGAPGYETPPPSPYGTPPADQPPSPYGSPSYGTPDQPSYGAPQGQPAYGTPDQPGYGAVPQGAYGAQPGYGAPAPYGAVPGAPYGVDPMGRPYSEKSKVVAGVLGIVLGFFGAGRFYTGHTGMAIAQLVVSVVTCGFGAIWGFVDGIMMLVGNPTDAQGRPLRG